VSARNRGGSAAQCSGKAERLFALEEHVKELIAIIRTGCAKLTKQKLAEKGFVAYTEKRVLGRGKQRGVQYGSEGGPNGKDGISFLPKRMLTLFVNDEDLETVMSILIEANKTGEIGDGKIFVGPADEAIRIRTDERSRAALV